MLAAGSALQRPHLLGGPSERADVRYNAACAAAMAGQAQLAQQLLEALLPTGQVQAAELAADDDLASLRGAAWLGELLARLQQQPA